MIDRKLLGLVLLAVSLICFLVALALSTGEVFHNGNHAAWDDGGFVALVASFLVAGLPAARP